MQITLLSLIQNGSLRVSFVQYTDLKPNSKPETPEENVKDIPTYNVVLSNTVHSSKSFDERSYM